MRAPAMQAGVEMLRRGHEVELDPEVDWADRDQIIWRLEDAAGPVVGSDDRGDGQAAGL
ncbi:MAG TPA: hypothetical protein VF116_09820 [Ktedonobacterales bacterium]